MTELEKPIRIMLVDDHAVTRAGFRFLLESMEGMSVVAEAADGIEALKLYASVKPALVILDMSMPGMGGREVLERLRQEWPDSKVLVCTMHESTALIEHTLQLGAAGYISKNSSPEELLAAIRRISQGHKYLDRELAAERITRNMREGVSGLESLTEREFQILCRYAEARASEDIAAELGITVKTVANNLTIIKEKLQVESVPALVRLAISKGLVSI